MRIRPNLLPKLAKQFITAAVEQLAKLGNVLFCLAVITINIREKNSRVSMSGPNPGR